MKMKYLEVDAEVRYWEDAIVNGIEDTDGSLIPGKDGDSWKVFINLETGTIENWPVGTTANIHYKVCDAGLYWLTDENKRRIATWNGSYVPDDFLCHGPKANGYGDYIIMMIDENGNIIEYKKPYIKKDEWTIINNPTMIDNPSRRGIIDPNKPGRYIIFDPNKEMDAEERAFQMWAVHPLDLDKLDMTRQEFYLAHLLAFKKQ